MVSNTLDGLDALMVAHDAASEGRDVRAVLATAPAWADASRQLVSGGWIPKTMEQYRFELIEAFNKQFGGQVVDNTWLTILADHLASQDLLLKNIQDSMWPDTMTGPQLDAIVGLTNVSK